MTRETNLLETCLDEIIKSGRLAYENGNIQLAMLYLRSFEDLDQIINALCAS